MTRADAAAVQVPTSLLPRPMRYFIHRDTAVLYVKQAETVRPAYLRGLPSDRDRALPR